MNEFIARCITSIVLLSSMLGAYALSPTCFALVLFVIYTLIMFFEWPQLHKKSTKISYIVYSCLYPTLPVLLLIQLTYKNWDRSWLLPIYPFLVAWTADTAGYLVGKLIGKHKICPRISPGKSWEGLLASIIGVTLLNITIMPHLNYQQATLLKNSLPVVIIFSIMITLIAFAGGLFLSILKRRNNLKNAGTLLPGHGGLLDRFDAVFFVTPIVWLFF